MSTQHYLKKLRPFKSAKIQKVNYYYRFLGTLSESENQQISDDFYLKHPLFKHQKLLKEVLGSYDNKGVVPDTNFVEALDDYFRVRVENC